MKRPQAYGNKVVTRYSDTTSMVLRNYLDISDQRLSKVRAGSHLPEVLQTEATPPLKKSKVAEKTIEAQVLWTEPFPIDLRRKRLQSKYPFQSLCRAI